MALHNNQALSALERIHSQYRKCGGFTHSIANAEDSLTVSQMRRIHSQYRKCGGFTHNIAKCGGFTHSIADAEDSLTVSQMRRIHSQYRRRGGIQSTQRSRANNNICVQQQQHQYHHITTTSSLLDIYPPALPLNVVSAVVWASPIQHRTRAARTLDSVPRLSFISWCAFVCLSRAAALNSSIWHSTVAFSIQPAFGISCGYAAAACSRSVNASGAVTPAKKGTLHEVHNLNTQWCSTCPRISW